jgi:diaminopropionate ammonia-lyase
VTNVLYRKSPEQQIFESPPTEPRAFHAALDGYAPTPLLELPALARRWGVGRVLMKMETDRLGLPSFKVLGASWATVEALRPLLPADWMPRDGLRALVGRLPVRTLVAATDGNHGRALARLARILELPSRIYAPTNISPRRRAAIAAEGAEIVEVDGSYDDAVARSAQDAEDEASVLVSDTSWPGYEAVPAAVIDGYSTILWEIEDQLGASASARPDLVFVQLGVGSFGAAVIRHFRRRSDDAPRLVGVEPESAACVMASLAAGAIVSVPGPHDSVMAGLNCGTPSLVAWPLLRDGLDAVVAVDDEPVLDAVRVLAGDGLDVGECSAAAVAAAGELLCGPGADEHRARLEVAQHATVLLFATEGVTDQDAFARAVGRPERLRLHATPR